MRLAFAFASVLLALPAAAQFYEPPPPTTTGLVLQAHLNGVRYAYDPGGCEGRVCSSGDVGASGGGFGVGVGYGFGRVFTLFAGYDLSIVGSSFLENSDEALIAGTLDLGARFHIPIARPEFVPYGQVALSGFAVLTEDEGDGSDGLGGGGLSFGGGALYFLNERIAIRAGADVTLGAYGTAFVDGEAEDLGFELDATNVRFSAGFAFYPFR